VLDNGKDNVNVKKRGKWTHRNKYRTSASNQ